MATGPRFYAPLFQALDALGVAIPGAELNFYLTTSSTRAATFSNETLTVANTNPVIADASGTFGPIFLNPLISYKVVLTYPDDGVVDPVEIWTADPVIEAWAADEQVFWDQPFQFLGGEPPGALEKMGMYTAARPQRIFGDFNGNSEGFAAAVGNCITAPTDNDVVVTIKQNNVTTVGTMTIAKTTGAFTFATTAGAAIDLDEGEFLIFIAPASPDSTFADAAWTITGINT